VVLNNTHRASDGSDHSRLAIYAKYAGKHTTVGGAAAEDITVSGAVAGDRCLVMIQDEGSTPRVLKSAKCGTDKITITFDADPSTDHILQYIVF
jgi:hypothetical protein